MKNNKTPKHSIKKLFLFALIMSVISMLSVSFSYRKVTSDLWGQLGINEESGLEHIKRSFLEGYFSHGRAKVLSGDKVAIASDLLAYTKEYINSEAFEIAYELERESRKPVSELAYAPKTKEQLQQQLISDTKDALKQYEQMIANMGPENRESMEETLEVYREQLRSYEDPDNPMLDYLVQTEQVNFEAQNRGFQEELKRWEEEYPADYNEMVKKRLERFLELTEDVDYEAALKEQYGLKKFVNPEYEKKPAEWKFAYRSGKEVTETARAFAQQWLSEIQ